MNDLNWPSKIILNKDKSQVRIEWETGQSSRLDAKLLRQHSPSAEVRGHSHAPKPLSDIDGDITINAIEPVGNYAVRIRFSDGHSTGLYQWSYLCELAGQT